MAFLRFQDPAYLDRQDSLVLYQVGGWGRHLVMEMQDAAEFISALANFAREKGSSFLRSLFPYYNSTEAQQPFLAFHASVRGESQDLQTLLTDRCRLLALEPNYVSETYNFDPALIRTASSFWVEIERATPSSLVTQMDGCLQYDFYGRKCRLVAAALRVSIPAAHYICFVASLDREKEWRVLDDGLVYEKVHVDAEVANLLGTCSRFLLFQFV